MTNTSIVSFSSQATSSLILWRNSYLENGHVPAKIKTASELGMCILYMTATVETVALGALTTGSLIFYGLSKSPFVYLSNHLSSSHFTIYWNASNALGLNFHTNNLITTEADARRNFDQSLFCSVVKLVVGIANAYFIFTNSAALFNTNIFASALKLLASTGYLFHNMTSTFFFETEENINRTDFAVQNNFLDDQAIARNLQSESDAQTAMQLHRSTEAEQLSNNFPFIDTGYHTITERILRLAEQGIPRNQGDFEVVPDEILIPQHVQVARLGEEDRVAGIDFIKNEIFNKIDQGSREVVFAFMPNAFDYVRTLTTYVFVFGSKNEAEIPSFLKQESRNEILILRYAIGSLKNQNIPFPENSQERAKILRIRSSNAGFQASVGVLKNFMVQNPLAPHNQQQFVSIENLEKDAALDEDSPNISNFLQNDQAKGFLNLLKLACFSEGQNSDFTTTCYQQAWQAYEAEHPEAE